MAYLRYQDYIKTIQDVNLQQIISGDDTQRTLSEVAAQEIVIERLTAKYDTSREFTDTNPYSFTTSYLAGQRAELNFPAYNALTAYVVNNLAVNAGSAYICTTNTTGVFTPGNWFLLGKQYDLFYITYPYPYFSYSLFYNVNDKVFYKNNVYTAKIATKSIDQQGALQFGVLDNIPPPNIFPDDVTLGTTYWGVGVPYSVTAGVLTTDITKWTKGDNRNPSLVRRVVQICVYDIHERIAPRGIPEQRANAYTEAIAWLDMAKEGEITVRLPLIQPKIDGRIRYGGAVRNINNY